MRTALQLDRAKLELVTDAQTNKINQPKKQKSKNAKFKQMKR